MPRTCLVARWAAIASPSTSPILLSNFVSSAMVWRTCPASRPSKRARATYARGMDRVTVAVAIEERDWHPEDGAAVWAAGYQPAAAATGRYLARDAAELTARGLRVAGVAGAGRHHADALASAD